MTETMNRAERSTLIGFFSESWDAERALEDLRFAGFEGRLRYVENDNIDHPDDSKEPSNVNRFFARVYGFEDEDEYLDSKGNWTVSPEAEEYFTDIYHRKNHVILVASDKDEAKALEILQKNHARIERQNFAFFYQAQPEQDRAIEDGPHNIPPRIHPTQAINPPLDGQTV